MDPATLILACVIHLTSGGHLTPSCDTDFIHDVAVAVEESSLDFNVPPDIIAAVIYHESRWRQFERGTHGDAGLMQIVRRGAVQGRNLRLSFRQLCDIKTNIRIGTAYLARVLPKCRSVCAGLTRYNGAYSCVSSKYSRCVLADLRMGRKAYANVLLTDYLSTQVNYWFIFDAQRLSDN